MAGVSGGPAAATSLEPWPTSSPHEASPWRRRLAPRGAAAEAATHKWAKLSRAAEITNSLDAARIAAVARNACASTAASGPKGDASSHFVDQGNSEFYEEHVIEERIALRKHRLVTEELHKWWLVLRQTYLDDASGSGETRGLSFADYCDLQARFYKVLIEPFDAADAAACAKEDFARDAGGDGTVDRIHACDCVFGIADVWTHGVTADVYASFLRQLLEAMVASGSPAILKPLHMISHVEIAEPTTESPTVTDLDGGLVWPTARGGRATRAALDAQRDEEACARERSRRAERHAASSRALQRMRNPPQIPVRGGGLKLLVGRDHLRSPAREASWLAALGAAADDAGPDGRQIFLDAYGYGDDARNAEGGPNDNDGPDPDRGTAPSLLSGYESRAQQKEARQRVQKTLAQAGATVRAQRALPSMHHYEDIAHQPTITTIDTTTEVDTIDTTTEVDTPKMHYTSARAEPPPPASDYAASMAALQGGRPHTSPYGSLGPAYGEACGAGDLLLSARPSTSALPARPSQTLVHALVGSRPPDTASCAPSIDLTAASVSVAPVAAPSPPPSTPLRAPAAALWSHKDAPWGLLHVDERVRGPTNFAARAFLPAANREERMSLHAQRERMQLALPGLMLPGDRPPARNAARMSAAMAASAPVSPRRGLAVSPRSRSSGGHAAEDEDVASNWPPRSSQSADSPRHSKQVAGGSGSLAKNRLSSLQTFKGRVEWKWANVQRVTIHRPGDPNLSPSTSSGRATSSSPRARVAIHDAATAVPPLSAVMPPEKPPPVDSVFAELGFMIGSGTRRQVGFA